MSIRVKRERHPEVFEIPEREDEGEAGAHERPTGRLPDDFGDDDGEYQHPFAATTSVTLSAGSSERDRLTIPKRVASVRPRPTVTVRLPSRGGATKGSDTGDRTVKRLPVGRADRSARAWQEVVDRREASANRSISRVQGTLDRPVSVVVGRNAPTITRALDRAPPNTTVVVPPGTYRVDDLRVQESVTIRGAGPNATRIVGDGNGSVLTVSASRTAVTSLSITGVGPNRSGANRSLDDAAISVNESSWKYQYWKVHGFGDAAIVFDDAPQGLVLDVQINTTSSGIIARNSPNTTVSELTLYGTREYQDGFIGVVALGSSVIVEDSCLRGGKVGVYAYDAPRTVVRNSSMEGMLVGVFDLYSAQLLVANNTIEDTWNAVYLETRSYGSAVVGNRLENNRNGVLVEGRSNYITNNTAVRNRHGIVVQGQYSLYRHNTMAYNRVGVRAMSLFPTNRMTANDVVHNRKYAETARYNVLHSWRGNFWFGAPGIDLDDDGRLPRTFRPTGPVDQHADQVRGVPTLGQSPALRLLRRLQRLMPGLRSGGVIDPRPRTDPVRPSTVRRLGSRHDETGRYNDPDSWDFYGI